MQKARLCEAGEVVGNSPSMMTGYHGQPAKTREAEWYSPEGKRYIRTGDVGRFDTDGFLTLFARKKDMITFPVFGVIFLVIAAVFLLPFVQSWLLPLFWFVAKTGALLFAFIWIRGTLPRFRYDQLMGFTWKFLFPVAMLNLLVTGFLVAWTTK